MLKEDNKVAIVRGFIKKENMGNVKNIIGKEVYGRKENEDGKEEEGKKEDDKKEDDKKEDIKKDENKLIGKIISSFGQVGKLKVEFNQKIDIKDFKDIILEMPVKKYVKLGKI